MRVTVIPNVAGKPGAIPKGLENKTGRNENRSDNRDYLDHSIVKIGQNTQMSLDDLRRPAVIQTPVKAKQLTLVWKTCKEYNIMWSSLLTKITE